MGSFGEYYMDSTTDRQGTQHVRPAPAPPRCAPSALRPTNVTGTSICPTRRQPIVLMWVTHKHGSFWNSGSEHAPFQGNCINGSSGHRSPWPEARNPSSTDNTTGHRLSSPCRHADNCRDVDTSSSSPSIRHPAATAAMLLILAL